MKEKYQKKKWESVKINAATLDKVRKHTYKTFIKTNEIVFLSEFFEKAAEEKLLREKL